MIPAIRRKIPRGYELVFLLNEDLVYVHLHRRKKGTSSIESFKLNITPTIQWMLEDSSTSKMVKVKKTKNLLEIFTEDLTPEELYDFFNRY